jgi:uncharacterized protein
LSSSWAPRFPKDHSRKVSTGPKIDQQVKVALRRISGLAEGDVPWGLPVFCFAEFVRVVTHLRVFTPPSPLADALKFLDRLMMSPSVRLLCPTNRFSIDFAAACQAGGVRGNLAFDAQIAAVCREYGVDKLMTADRDFARFQSFNLAILAIAD